jgi:hypothetical protein
VRACRIQPNGATAAAPANTSNAPPAAPAASVAPRAPLATFRTTRANTRMNGGSRGVHFVNENQHEEEQQRPSGVSQGFFWSEADGRLNCSPRLQLLPRLGCTGARS